MKTVRSYLLILVASWSLVLLPVDALAQANFGCAAGTPTTTTDTFYNVSNGACSYSGMAHIFSQIVCQFGQIINSVLASVYCGMQFSLTSVIGALVTLYIVIFGAQILMGTTQLTAREILVRLIKIAGVWMFVTNAYWGIGIAFNFFFDISIEGISWVLNSIPQQSSLFSGDIIPLGCDQPDTGSGTITQFYTSLDFVVCRAIAGPFSGANIKVIGFFVVMAYTVPPLFMLGLAWLWINFNILSRALVSFLLGLAVIAFLIALGPIFLSFMLFATTVNFFEQWLKYLISYSLQIVVVFACIALWLIITSDFIQFFNDLSNIVVPFQNTEASGPYTQIENSYGICPCPPGTTPGTCAPSPPDSYGAPTYICSHGGQVIPPSRVPQQSDFIYYVVYHLMTLTLVAYAFSALLQQAPQIAVQLAGPEYVPRLGQGFGFNRYGLIQRIMPQSGGGQSSGGLLQSIQNRIGGASNDFAANARQSQPRPVGPSGQS